MSGTHSTRSVWRAAFLAAHGLPLIAARRRASGVVQFLFDDPNNEAAKLVRDFDDDHDLQKLIDARFAISAAITHAREYGTCHASDIAAELGRLNTPWAARRSPRPEEPAGREDT